MSHPETQGGVPVSLVCRICSTVGRGGRFLSLRSENEIIAENRDWDVPGHTAESPEGPRVAPASTATGLCPPELCCGPHRRCVDLRWGTMSS